MFYINGNVLVKIDTETGTKIRYTKDDAFMPMFPESIDCTITYKCDGHCNFCYMNCTESGKHANLESDYVKNIFVPSLRPYTELAINGNDLSHPQFEGFLGLLKERKVIANVTVNQKHFLRNIPYLKELTDKKLIKGLGISLTEATDELIKDAKRFPDAVIHTIAGILTEDELEALGDNDLKLLILGYKLKGRGKEYFGRNKNKVSGNLRNLRNKLPDIIRSDKFRTVGFDTLALDQLNIRNLLSDDEWNTLYQGKEGSFTFFVDLVKNQFARNSSETDVLYGIDNLSAVDMFNIIKGDKIETT